MKTRLSRILILCLAVVMMVSLAACNSSDPAGSPSTSPEASPTDSAPETSPSDEPEASPSDNGGDDLTEKFSSMEDLVNSDIMQAQLETMKDSMETDEMSMTITGEGNKLIYTYTFKTAQDADVIGPVLSSGLETQASTFENIASTMGTLVEVDNPVVVVRYLNNDGSELCSQEFSAK